VHELVFLTSGTVASRVIVSANARNGNSLAEASALVSPGANLKTM
jgi:hypothetical protein